jgi:hypothetical protein
MKTKNGHAPPTEVHARHRNNVSCFKGAASYMFARLIASYIVVFCRLLRPRDKKSVLQNQLFFEEGKYTF